MIKSSALNINVNIEIKIYLSYWFGVHNEQMINISAYSDNDRFRFFEGTFRIIDNNIRWRKHDVRFSAHGSDIPIEIKEFCDKMIKLRLFE